MATPPAQPRVAWAPGRMSMVTGTGGELDDLPVDLQRHRVQGPERVTVGAGLRGQAPGGGAQRSDQDVRLGAVAEKDDFEPAIVRGGVVADGGDLRHLVDVREQQARDTHPDALDLDVVRGEAGEEPHHRDHLPQAALAASLARPRPRGSAPPPPT